MLRPLVVLWLAAPSALSEHRADIVDWTRSLERRPVYPAAHPRSAPYDAALAEQIERLLEEARSAPPSEREPFVSLDRLISEHPELPQAAFWMAERHALAARHRRPLDGDAPQAPASHANGTPHEPAAAPADSSAALALALEGPRAPVFGDRHAVPAEPASGGPLRLHGMRSGDTVMIDGLPTAAGDKVEAGRHHVQVFRHTRRLWAAWVELGAPPELSLTDSTSACSELDLMGTHGGATGPEPSPGVLCSEWAVARPGIAAGIEVALCRGSRCGHWQAKLTAGPPAYPLVADGATDAAQSGLPGWVTWSAVGIGTAVAASLILWQTGAFDRTPPDTEFVFTGPSAGALQF